ASPRRIGATPADFGQSPHGGPRLPRSAPKSPPARERKGTFPGAHASNKREPCPALRPARFWHKPQTRTADPPMARKTSTTLRNARTAAAGSWLALLAATTLGDAADTLRAEVRAAG